MISVETFLQSHDIAYILHEHPAVFTCEEAEKYCSHISGLACKNLFLKSKKNDRYFLVILPAKKRADMKRICELVQEKGITFASPDLLLEKLGVEPGSVSIFSLLNDQGKNVEVYIDQDVHSAKSLTFHPNRNTASIELTGPMFHHFLEKIENKIQVID